MIFDKSRLTNVSTQLRRHSYYLVLVVAALCCQCVADFTRATHQDDDTDTVPLDDTDPPVIDCGNDLIDAEEECDRQNLDDQTCEALGYLSGTLKCTDNCQLDESDCVAAADCNNGTLEPGEVCDGNLLNNQNCESLTGLTEGDIYCHASCLRFDTSECHECGNGICEDPIETADTCDLDCARLVAGGEDHSCGVKPGGTAYCWGLNLDGQLGTGNVKQYLTPTLVSGLTHVLDITAGLGQFSCALKTDGTIWCWGDNEFGPLGTGNHTPSLTPVQVQGLADAADVVGGKDHSCALLKDGSVWCWGLNEMGQIGDGTTTTRLSPVKTSGLSTVVELVSAKNANCARNDNGDVYCWGENDFGQADPGNFPHNAKTPVAIVGLSNVVKISAAGKNVCALMSDQTVQCFGDNTKGQIGIGSVTDWEPPHQVTNLTGVTDIHTGEKVACALVQDQTVWCWGENNRGQLGNNKMDKDSSVPVHVLSLTSVDQLMGGKKHVFAKTTDGKFWGWGENEKGQLGIGTLVNQPTPVSIQF